MNSELRFKLMMIVEKKVKILFEFELLRPNESGDDMMCDSIRPKMNQAEPNWDLH